MELTTTQVRILALIAEGRSVPTIAADLDLTDEAMGANLVSARRTLDAADTSSAITHARELNLI